VVDLLRFRRGPGAIYGCSLTYKRSFWLDLVYYILDLYIMDYNKICIFD